MLRGFELSRVRFIQWPAIAKIAPDDFSCLSWLTQAIAVIYWFGLRGFRTEFSNRIRNEFRSHVDESRAK